MKYHFTIVVEKDADGYSASCPQLQGCYAQGATYEKAIENIEDAIRLHAEDRKEQQEEWSEPEYLLSAAGICPGPSSTLR